MVGVSNIDFSRSYSFSDVGSKEIVVVGFKSPFFGFHLRLEIEIGVERSEGSFEFV